MLFRHHTVAAVVAGGCNRSTAGQDAVVVVVTDSIFRSADLGAEMGWKMKIIENLQQKYF